MLAAPAIGHNAIGAEVGAALNDGHEASWAAVERNFLDAVGQAVLPGPGLKLVEVAGLEEEVHLGETLVKLAGVAIHQAASDGQQGFRPLCLKLFERGELAHYPILGALAYYTTVEQDDIGLCRDICPP